MDGGWRDAHGVEGGEIAVDAVALAELVDDAVALAKS